MSRRTKALIWFLCGWGAAFAFFLSSPLDMPFDWPSAPSIHALAGVKRHGGDGFTNFDQSDSNTYYCDPSRGDKPIVDARLMETVDSELTARGFHKRITENAPHWSAELDDFRDQRLTTYYKTEGLILPLQSGFGFYEDGTIYAIGRVFRTRAIVLMSVSIGLLLGGLSMAFSRRPKSLLPTVAPKE